MDPLSQIQTFLIIAFLIFIGFVGIVLFLLVNLLVSRHNLKIAQAELKNYSESLEEMVELRTSELKASEQKYKELFVNAKEAIIVYSSESHEIIDVNSEATFLFGCTRNELLHMNFDDLKVFDISVDHKKEWSEHVIKRKDQATRYIDCVVGSIIYDGLDCNQVICRDVTDKRKLEAQLMQSQKMVSLGQLAAGVAHELNTPLSAIYSSSYYIKDFLHKKPAKIPRHIEIIEIQIERCRKIIQDLLNFSRAPGATLELESVNLNDLIESCLSLIGKEIKSGGIHLDKDLQKLPMCLIDSSRMSQVIFNILLNAVQAMPSGGNLSIKSWHDAEFDSLPDNGSKAGAIHICIEDTGDGISKEDLLEIFTPFFSTKKSNGGIGLGLSVAYEIIKSFKGNIKVSSEHNSGTTVQINLPVES